MPGDRYMEDVGTTSILAAKRVLYQVNKYTSAQIRLPTLALKPRRDITRSPKQGYQWPHKNDLCPPKMKILGPGRLSFPNIETTFAPDFQSVVVCLKSNYIELIPCFQAITT